MSYSPQQVLLRRLEESIPEPAPVSADHFPKQRDANVLVDDTSLPEEEDYSQPQNVQQPSLSLADIKDFLSARDLKAVRSDSSKRYSACFGRRMDRIGSMTSLGCNTIGRSSKFTELPGYDGSGQINKVRFLPHLIVFSFLYICRSEEKMKS